uniref:Ovate family protein n=1 Tax=Strongyloides papillosus TaxID=174720 RepID=A0A0N5B2J9_STREA
MPSFWRKSWKGSIISSVPPNTNEPTPGGGSEFPLHNDDIEFIDGSPSRLSKENRRSFNLFHSTKDDIILNSFNRFFKKRNSYQNIEAFSGVQLPRSDLVRRRKPKMNGNTSKFYKTNSKLIGI